MYNGIINAEQMRYLGKLVESPSQAAPLGRGVLTLFGVRWPFRPRLGAFDAPSESPRVPPRHPAHRASDIATVGERGRLRYRRRDDNNATLLALRRDEYVTLAVTGGTELRHGRVRGHHHPSEHPAARHRAAGRAEDLRGSSAPRHDLHTG
eukprot:1161936-Pyramimonas_sp.AAC.2